ncbi:fungal-specific transcription factor domain-containing protein [Hypoxylon trugodes]|uniref:fungal-specific transcription factor domain-containing protein n=1 Tax=Hypoxylon trugodes TaxID=326681 RepID=UPI00219703E0|nr:fungal-specific transcription factor domain-containing protein [Hypoxylon trugodes]KAI1387792.1 fungal-specific transcription factor domain-containing protein [Hypoxylon trugodes]
MNVSELESCTKLGEPVRNKRRPALACLHCRKRKIKCDRQTPCLSCTKANETCIYVYDSRRTPTTAPFDASEIQVSVFEQTPRRELIRAMASPKSPAKYDPSVEESSGGTSGSPSISASSKYSLPLQASESASVFPMEPGLDPTTILEDIIVPSISPAPYTYPIPLTNTPVSGVFYKSRYYGESHWLNFLHLSPEVCSAIQTHESRYNEPDHITFAKCKSLSRNIKANEILVAHTLISIGSVRDLVPTKTASTRLVQAYIRTFQTVFGILHIPSFNEEYKVFWDDSTYNNEVFDITLLLVMYIGSTFCPSETGVTHSMIDRWVPYILSRLSTSQARIGSDFDNLRIHTLLLLARQTRRFSCNVPWLSSGFLLRMAMQMGLHIDPENQPIPVVLCSEVEPRRRLWAAIIELEVQSSLDYGHIPCINSGDYDCLPPSNIDDSTFAGNTTAGMPQPLNLLTQTSFQILLMMTMPIRLKIVKFVNDFRAEKSFEKALGLGSEISATSDKCFAIIEDYRMSSRPPTVFQTKMFELLVKRFFMALHHPFATRSNYGTHYHFSRKLCLDTSVALLSGAVESTNDHFYHISLYGTGLYCNTYTQAALYLGSELVNTCQMQDDWLFTAATHDEMRKAIDRYLELRLARLKACDRGFKYYVFVSCLLAQAEAKQMGRSEELEVQMALKRSLEMCYSTLQTHTHSHEIIDWEMLDVHASFVQTDELSEIPPWDNVLGI